MRRLSAALAAFGLVAFIGRRLEARRDAANIRRLARHLGCSADDARRVYEIARVRGFGAAYREVFGAPPAPEVTAVAREVVEEPVAVTVEAGR